MLTSSLESSLAFWEVVEYIAGGVVIVGAAGEGLGEFTNFLGAKRCHERKDLILKVSTIILIVGLAVGLWGLDPTNERFGQLIVDVFRKAGHAHLCPDRATD